MPEPNPRRRRTHGRGRTRRMQRLVRSQEWAALKSKAITLQTELSGNRYGLKKTKPNNGPLIQERLVRALQENRPLPIIIFWGGAKKSASGVGDYAELTTIGHLAHLKARLERGGLQTRFVLLFMDVYETRLNHRTPAEVERYRTSLLPLVKMENFELFPVSKVYEDLKFNPDRLRPSERKKEDRVKELYERLRRESPETLVQLERLAKSHGSDDPHKTVELYVKLHAFDDLLLDRTFPGAIYLSFGNPNTQRVISKLPTLFYYQDKEHGKIGEMGVPWMTEKPY